MSMMSRVTRLKCDTFEPSPKVVVDDKFSHTPRPFNGRQIALSDTMRYPGNRVSRQERVISMS